MYSLPVTENGTLDFDCHYSTKTLTLSAIAFSTAINLACAHSIKPKKEPVRQHGDIRKQERY